MSMVSPEIVSSINVIWPRMRREIFMRILAERGTRGTRRDSMPLFLFKGCSILESVPGVGFNHHKVFKSFRRRIGKGCHTVGDISIYYSIVVRVYSIKIGDYGSVNTGILQLQPPRAGSVNKTCYRCCIKAKIYRVCPYANERS